MRGSAVLDNYSIGRAGSCLACWHAAEASRFSSSGVETMKTTLSSAFGFALLAVSFCFGSAFACSNSGETLTSIVNAQTAENDQPQGGDVNQAEAVKAEQPP